VEGQHSLPGRELPITRASATGTIRTSLLFGRFAVLAHRGISVGSLPPRLVDGVVDFLGRLPTSLFFRSLPPYPFLSVWGFLPSSWPHRNPGSIKRNFQQRNRKSRGSARIEGTFGLQPTQRGQLATSANNTAMIHNLHLRSSSWSPPDTHGPSDALRDRKSLPSYRATESWVQQREELRNTSCR